MIKWGRIEKKNHTERSSGCRKEEDIKRKNEGGKKVEEEEKR